MEISRKELLDNYVNLDIGGCNGNLYIDLNNQESMSRVIKIFKSSYRMENREKTLDYLMSFSKIIGSGYPLEKLYLDGQLLGYISDYFRNSFSFNSSLVMNRTFYEKIKASRDVDSQLREIHNRDIIFHDINCGNLLIDSNGGHIIDFEDVLIPDALVEPYSLYNLCFEKRPIAASKKLDQLKLLISVFSLLYIYDIERYFVFNKDISKLLEFVKDDKVLYEFVSECLSCINNKNKDTLPYISEVLYDIDEDKIYEGRSRVRKLLYRWLFIITMHSDAKTCK